MKHMLWILLMATVFSCSDEQPTATRVIKQVESGNATQRKVLIAFNEPIYSAQFGLAPNPNVDGKTLAQIVSSQTVGRDDGLLCSGCHNRNDPQGGYGVPASRNAASPELKPTDVVSKRKWVGPDGWAERFVKNNTKPSNIQVFVQAWIDNSYK